MFKAENIQLKDKLQKTNFKCEKLEERIISLEVASRRNNLKFIPMKNTATELWQNEECDILILELCTKYGLDLDQTSIERAHRLSNRQKITPIIVKFLNYRDRLRVLKAKQKFRNGGILLVEDFPSEVV